MLLRPETKRLYWEHKLRKLLVLCLIFGSGHSLSAVSFSGSVVIPQVTKYARGTAVTFDKVRIFTDFSFGRTSQNRWNTFRSLSGCSWKVSPITITPSRYTRHDWYVRPLKTISIYPPKFRWVIAVAKSMSVNWHSPWYVNNAVFSLSSGCRPIW
jgi:hypothetical protein